MKLALFLGAALPLPATSAFAQMPARTRDTALGSPSAVGQESAPAGAETYAAWEARRAAVAKELRAEVTRNIGPIAKPRDIVFVDDVPKTRSGKIMRRLLTQLFEGTTLGDTTSLQNEPCIPGIDAVCRELASL